MTTQYPATLLRACLQAIALALLSAPSNAHDHDFQQWTQFTAQGLVADRIVAYVEAQPRFTNNASRLGQMILRPALGVQLTDTTQAMAGYAFIHSDMAEASISNEHRVWEQLSWSIYKGDTGLTVNTRTRLEQRLVDNQDDLGWRLRQQVRAQMPLQPEGNVSGVVWVEPFYTFNKTDWGQREGFDQVRTFLGVNFPLAKNFVAEPGYINQTVFRDGEDRMNHVLNVSFNYRW